MNTGSPSFTAREIAIAEVRQIAQRQPEIDGRARRGHEEITMWKSAWTKLTALAFILISAITFADLAAETGETRAFYVASNKADGNTLVGFARQSSGKFSKIGEFPTGGKGTGDLEIPALQRDVTHPLANGDDPADLCLRRRGDGRPSARARRQCGGRYRQPDASRERPEPDVRQQARYERPLSRQCGIARASCRRRQRRTRQRQGQHQCLQDLGRSPRGRPGFAP